MLLPTPLVYLSANLSKNYSPSSPKSTISCSNKTITFCLLDRASSSKLAVFSILSCYVISLRVLVILFSAFSFRKLSVFAYPYTKSTRRLVSYATSLATGPSYFFRRLFRIGYSYFLGISAI